MGAGWFENSPALAAKLEPWEWDGNQLVLPAGADDRNPTTSWHIKDFRDVASQERVGAAETVEVPHLAVPRREVPPGLRA